LNDVPATLAALSSARKPIVPPFVWQKANTRVLAVIMGIKEKFEKEKGTFAVDTCTQHHFSTGLYAKEMHLPKGFYALSHAHAYDHFSILAKGKAEVDTGESKAIYTAPVCIEIKAGIHHQITALEDVTWFCIHATNETDIAKIDEVAIHG